MRKIRSALLALACCAYSARLRRRVRFLSSERGLKRRIVDASAQNSVRRRDDANNFVANSLSSAGRDFRSRLGVVQRRPARSSASPCSASSPTAAAGPKPEANCVYIESVPARFGEAAIAAANAFAGAGASVFTQFD